MCIRNLGVSISPTIYCCFHLKSFYRFSLELYIVESPVDHIPSGTDRTSRLQFVLAPVWIGIPRKKTCSPCKHCFPIDFCFSTLQHAFCLCWISCSCMTAIYKQSCNCFLPAAVSCGPAPDAPANSQRSGSGTTFGSTVIYTCNRGYTLQGDRRRTCMANGYWSGRASTCYRKLLCSQMLCKHMFYWYVWTLSPTKVQDNDVAVQCQTPMNKWRITIKIL